MKEMHSKRERERREVFFLLLAGVFLTSLTLGNVIGITKFVDVKFFQIPAGLLAYPVTFLATDLISELFGRRRAQSLVFVGFVMNIFMLGLMWLGHALPDAAGVSGASSTFVRVGACFVRSSQWGSKKSNPRKSCP